MSTLPENTPKEDETFLPEIGDIASEATSPAGEPLNIEALQRAVENVPVKVAAVLGKTKIDVASLRALADGSVIELDRRVGEPIDLYVNDRLIARGELVMVDGSIGVTMTEIVKEGDL